MDNSLFIYYATMTGNAEELAINAESRTRAAGWIPQLHNLSEASPQSITEAKRALFIVSTWGDGEPPDDAAPFFEELQDSSVNLSHLDFAILGLGDESYPDFNQFAKDLEQELKRLGANAFHPRIDADAYFDETYEFWIAEVLEALAIEKAKTA